LVVEGFKILDIPKGMPVTEVIFIWGSRKIRLKKIKKQEKGLNEWC
jgi:hypothetical protein